MTLIDIPIILDYPTPKNKKDLLSEMLEYLTSNKSKVLSYGTSNIGNTTIINIIVKSSDKLDSLIYNDATKR